MIRHFLVDSFMEPGGFSGREGSFSSSISCWEERRSWGLQSFMRARSARLIISPFVAGQESWRRSGAESGRQSDGFEEALRVGFPLPCNVQGSAVIHRGSYDRQAEGAVNGSIEGKGLERDMSLVVIHADKCVGNSPTILQECGIRRKRSFDPDGAGPGDLNGGGDDSFLFFVSKEPPFSSVGIEATNRERRLLSPQVPDGLMGKFDYVQNPFRGEKVGDLMVTDVNSDKAAGENVRSEHHAEALRPGVFREDLGLSGLEDTCAMERFLVGRGGGNRVDISAKAGINGFREIAISGSAGCGTGCSRGKLIEGNRVEIADGGGVAGAQFGQSENRTWRRSASFFRAPFHYPGVAKDDGDAKVRNLLVLEEIKADLRADPCRVSHCYGNFRAAHAAFLSIAGKTGRR